MCWCWMSQVMAQKPEFVIQTGHQYSIPTVAFSPDGKVIVSGGWDHSLKLWDVATGRELYALSGYSRFVYSVAFSPDGKSVASGSNDSTIKLLDVATGRELLSLSGHSGGVKSVTFSPDGKTLVSCGGDASVKLWNVATGELLATRFSFDGDEWALVDPKGRFDASAGGMKYLHYVSGLTTIALEQLKERYYEPGLLSKLFGYSREPLRDVSAFNEVKLFPEVKLILAPGSSQLTINLTDRGGGVGRVQVFINDSELIEDARGVGVKTVSNTRVTSDAPSGAVTVNLLTALNLKPGESNRIRVVAWNSEGYLSSSPGEEIEWTAPGAVDAGAPNLYGIVGGISNYSGDARMNLLYPAQDARAIANVLKVAAARLFGADGVKIRLLVNGAATAAVAPARMIEEAEPTKANFLSAFADVARRARPNDVVMIFLAGHGISLGINNSEYCYPTRDARTLDKDVFSDPELRKQQLITSGEMKDLMTKIPALHRVMIFDTCEAGAAASDLAMVRNVSSDQKRALDRLKDRTGFHILMGAAASKASYEHSSFGQGLLTYALIVGISRSLQE